VRPGAAADPVRPRSTQPTGESDSKGGRAC
jgi:hypothetical protein